MKVGRTYKVSDDNGGGKAERYGEAMNKNLKQ